MCVKVQMLRPGLPQPLFSESGAIQRRCQQEDRDESDLFRPEETGRLSIMDTCPINGKLAFNSWISDDLKSKM